MADRTLKTAVALLVCALSLSALQAASFTYSDSAKRIKAGVLLTEGSSTDHMKRPDPYVFHVMNQRYDLKPSGWDFYNPLAASHVTNDILGLWSGAYDLGEALQRDMGAYWEVNLLSISPEDLAEYDVLYLTNWGMLTFSNRDREKLRKFVDNGGVLWVDYQDSSLGGTQFAPQKFFVDDFEFMNTGTQGTAVVNAGAYGHALANRPFYISRNDASRLGGIGDPLALGKIWIGVTNEAAQCFVPIILREGKPTVYAAQYGSGYVVVTADGIGKALTEPVGKDNGKCGTLFMAAHPEDLKLAYNIVNWGSEHSTYHKNPRRTGYSFAEIGGSLVNLWRYTDELGPAPTDSAPAILDDMIFYVDGHNILHAFDLSPVRDRDMNGNPDDGIPDYVNGAPYDELWRAQMPGPCSPPTAAYVQLVPGTPTVPAVFVVTQAQSATNAELRVYNALAGIEDPPYQTYFSGVTALQPFTAPPGGAISIPAPTYADGMLYVGDGKGYLHVKNMKLAGNNEWMHPRNTTTASLGTPCSPSVGYLYDPTSGATEQLAYIATHGEQSRINGAIRSYPIRVFNETLSLAKRISAGEADFRVRAINNYIDSTANPRLYWAINIFDTPTPFNGFTIDPARPGYVKVTDPLALSKYDNGGMIIADYSIQYVNADKVPPPNTGATDAAWDGYFNTAQFRTIGISHPEISGACDGAGITGSPAIGKNDILYYGTENGSIYAAKETGRTQGTTDTPVVHKWRWFLGDPQAQVALGATGGTFQIVGAPALHGDMVYVAVNHDTMGGYILAFKADPVFSITLKERIAPGTQVIVRQPDRLTDPSGGKIRDYVAVSYTDMDKATPNTSVLVDYDTSKLTIINFRPRGGQYDLTASEDIAVVYTPDGQTQQGAGGQPITEEHKAFAAGTPDKLNNLEWYVKLNHPVNGPLQVVSSPTIMGDILYVGCDQGVLVSLDVAKAAQAPGGMTNGVRVKPWNNNSDYIKAHPVAPVSGAPVTAPIAGSHGLLAIATADGLSIMYNPTSLIADGNRIIEVDASGKAVWTCDSTVGFTSTFAVPSSGSGHWAYGSANTPFNRPSVAKRAPVGGIVVADTGNNRIVHIDKGGQGIWMVKDFVDPDPANPIVTPGTPMELSMPTDVTCWMTMGNVGGYTLPEYHYLIADSGNYRVVEVVAQYDPATGSYRNILKQVSGNLDVGKRYRFLTARILESDVNGPTKLVCAVSNDDSSQPTGLGMGGEVVALEWQTRGLIGKIPSLPLPPPGLGIADVSPLRAVMNPTFCNRQWISNIKYADVVIDSTGVHVCVVSRDPAATDWRSATFNIRSYLVSDHVDIDEATGLTIPSGTRHARPFAPSYAQYLPNDNVLVANKATGQAYEVINGTVQLRPFNGEVFELAPDPSSPKRMVRIPGTSISYTADMHQPLSAERLMY